MGTVFRRGEISGSELFRRNFSLEELTEFLFKIRFICFTISFSSQFFLYGEVLGEFFLGNFLWVWISGKKFYGREDSRSDWKHN